MVRLQSVLCSLFKGKFKTFGLLIHFHDMNWPSRQSSFTVSFWFLWMVWCPFKLQVLHTYKTKNHKWWDKQEHWRVPRLQGAKPKDERGSLRINLQATACLAKWVLRDFPLWIADQVETHVVCVNGLGLCVYVYIYIYIYMILCSHI